MSIASIGLINTLDLNNVNLGTNGQPNSVNGYANLTFSNDIVPNLGVPSATYTIGMTPSTDPNIPNFLDISVATNNPNVSPTAGVIAFAPTGGGNVGNGTAVIIEGDLSCNGDILTQIQNATSLATDNNGRIIAGSGSPSAYKWNLGNAIFQDGTFGDTTPSSLSYAVIDPSTRIVSIFLNVVLILSGSYTNQTPQLTIDINTSWTPSATGTLPPPTALFQSLLPTNNTITTFAGVNLSNFSTNPYSVLCDNFYMSAYFVNSGLMNVRGLQPVSATNGQRVIYSGIIQYPY